jgi:hypothetical protein
MKSWTHPPSLSAAALALAFAGLLTTWSGGARATPEFPAVVEQTLGLTSITIDPPQGCTLCHTSDSGGQALRTFGALLQQYGVQPYQDDTLKGALAAVEEKEPQFIADIKAGRDPNDDQSASSIPTPEYGCAAAPGLPRSGAGGVAWGWPLAFIALAAVGVRAARARAHQRVRNGR